MLVIDPSHADFVLSEDGALLREDVLSWAEWYKGHYFFKNQDIEIDAEPCDKVVFLLDRLFRSFPEFRSLLDYRLLSRPKLRHYKLDVFRRATELHINCPSIGPRFRIQHGHNTYVFAREIGSDFWVNHNVTLGSNGGVPSLGNRVTIRTGAIVVGPISVGDDVIITANSVVNFDVPQGHATYPPRTTHKLRKKFVV